MFGKLIWKEDSYIADNCMIYMLVAACSGWESPLVGFTISCLEHKLLNDSSYHSFPMKFCFMQQLSCKLEHLIFLLLT